jgi:nitrate reductase gamma subunit
MREALNHWNFVIAAYAVGVIGTALLIGWAWLSMKRAESRRDKVKGK